MCDRTHISSEALTWAILLGNDDLFELIDFRSAIDIWSLLNLQQRFQDEPESVKTHLKTLEGYVKTMEAAAHKSEQKRFFEVNFQFHYGIVEASGNALFVSIYHFLHSFIQETMLKTRTFGAGRELKTINEEHCRILEAIRTGNTENAVNLIKEHLHHQKRSLNYLTRVESGRSDSKKKMKIAHGIERR